MSALQMIPKSGVDFFTALLRQLPRELRHHLPPGWGTLLVSPERVTVPSGYRGELRISRNTCPIGRKDGNGVMYYRSEASYKIMLLDERIVAAHHFTLPDDWPYRRGGSCYLTHEYEYADPEFLDQLGAYVADLGADPHYRSREWKPRKPPSYESRERWRLRLIEWCRQHQLTVVDHWSLDIIRGVYDDNQTLPRIKGLSSW